MLSDLTQPDARASLALASSLSGFDPRPQALNLPEKMVQQINETVLGLDQWLEAMRVPGGYGGPVIYWWSDSLDYNGPGLDWRYEGIISGYLNLWHATSNPDWMLKARRAGDDLLAGQFASGNFRNSGFELNPNTGSTPHEAAACLGLVKLALALRALNDASWTRYYQAARLNIQKYHIRYLWDARQHVFYDGPTTPSVSPDRLATLAEVLFSLTRLSGESSWIEQYGFACLDAILAHQVTHDNLSGAIHYRSSQKVKESRFFPLLIARCIPALILGYTWTKDAIFVEAVKRSGNFLARLCLPDGSFPQVLYGYRKVNRWPAWVAPAGDMVRALMLAGSFAVEFDPAPSLEWILAGRVDSGAIRSAVGYGRAMIPPRRKDPRDQIASCGWVDKAFRLFSVLVDPVGLEALMFEGE